MTIRDLVDFSEIIAERTQHFTGRQWVFAALDHWLQGTEFPSTPESRRFLLTGGPGSGKSAIAARLVQFDQGQVEVEDVPRLVPGFLAYHHFCQAFNEEALSPQTFVRALSLALSQGLPGFAEALIQVKDPAITIHAEQQVGTAEASAQVQNVVIGELFIGKIPSRSAFDQLVRQPLLEVYRAGWDQDLFILVDSLDEALTFDIEDNIAQLLAEFTDHPGDLPSQVRFVLTSRPDPRVLRLFGEPSLDLVDDAPHQAVDVYDYAYRRLPGLEVVLRADFAAKVRDASAGNFLYARYILDDLLKDEVTPSTLEGFQLPAGLADVYRQFLKRELGRNQEQWGTRYRTILGLLAVARSPGLTPAHLEAATGLPLSQTRDVLVACGQYLAGTAPNGPYTIYHQSFRDFLFEDSEYNVYPAEADQALGVTFLDAFHGAWGDCDDEYILRFTPTHLTNAITALDSPLKRKLRKELLTRLTGLLQDLAYLQSRVRLMEGQTFALESDYTRALAMMESGEDQIVLQALTDALRQESHLIQIDPNVLFIQFYNRLYRGEDGPFDKLLQASELAPSGPWLQAFHALPSEGALLRRIPAGETSSASLALLGDGRRLLTAAHSGEIKIYEVETSALSESWQLEFWLGNERLNRALVLPGDLLLASDYEGNITLWDVPHDELLFSWDGPTRCYSLTPARDGLLIGKENGEFELWELAPRRVVRRWRMPDHGSRTVLTTPDGKYGVAGGGKNDSDRGHIWTWALEWEAGESPDPPGSWRELADLRQFSISTAEIPADEGGIDRDILAYQTSVTALSISEDGRWVVAADDDGGMWLWDLPAANLKRSWFADSSLVRACAVSAHAGLVLTGGVDSHLKLWDLETGNLLASLRGHTGQVMEMVINEDGSRVVTSGGAGSLIVWDLEAGRTAVPRPAHGGKVQAICFSPDGSQALSGGEDGSLLLWEVGTGQTLGSWSHPSGEVYVVGFTPQGQLLSGGRDGHLYLWEPGTREPVDSWECPIANDVDLQILSLSATKERILVVSAGYYEDFFVIWQLVDGVPAVLYQGDQRVRHAVVSDDTQTAVLFGDQFYLWQAGTFQEINAVTNDYYAPDAAVLSPDSERVYMGNLYGQIGVLNPIVDGGYYLLGAHINYVNALALSPDERYLVTGGWDTTLRIWDLENGVEVGRYTWELPLEAAAAHHDGEALRLVVGDKHGSLLFFTLQIVEYLS